MPINEWSDSIVIAELSDEPSLSEDLDALLRTLDEAPGPLPDVVVNGQSVTYVNSSNVAQLIKLNKKVTGSGARLRLCALSDKVWSVLLVTGLDKLFEVHGDVATAIASLQIMPAE